MKRIQINVKKVILIGLTALLICILSLFSFLFMTGKLNVAIVLSDSMKPTISAGDLLISKSSKEKSINIGDIVTFEDNTGVTVTHRVVDIKNDSVMTKGDAVAYHNTELVDSSSIKSTYVAHVPYLGYVISWIASPWGFIIFYIVPVWYISYALLKKFILKPKKYTRYFPQEN
ncbi:signal peptidase I [Bacillus alkalisoli]|uniref:signal peptidase I n=1 Tax=Bacillus alkalisoli TaxID=2011008 RepID=UPI000C240F99|nr:signal peptidase I [Bacillus alkalisoli]